MYQTDKQNEKLYDLIDQIFEIERKLSSINESNSIHRNLDKMKRTFEEIGLVYHNPINEPYNETRTDLSVSISGTANENLIVTEVIKPIIRLRSSEGITRIVRQGVVVVSAQSKEEK